MAHLRLIDEWNTFRHDEAVALLLKAIGICDDGTYRGRLHVNVAEIMVCWLIHAVLIIDYTGLM